MAKTLQIEIVTHSGIAYQGEVDSLVAPGIEGYFGMLPRHAPLIAELAIGDLRLRQGTRWTHFAIGGGILHLRDGRVVVMADSAELATDIDVDRARQAEQRARGRLALRRAADIDNRRAEIALARAVNRLRVASMPPD
jgi:F-type H+-transporting ATPase subunit epsilon